MGLALRVVAGIMALIGYAPNIVFLGGLAKLTNLVNKTGFVLDYGKQVTYMLEWYLVSFGLLYWIIIAVTAWAGALRRAHVIFVGWLMCTSALLILCATKYLPVINCLATNDGVKRDCAMTTATGNVIFEKDNMPFLRCIAAGQISMAAWNFIVAIFITVADNEETPEHAKAAPANAA